ncbi:hypothetical protein CfE428DRAFT_5620 [Chthoniobacter flavus Ellin428]|uniref:Uncharacterized protein n=1 Tax=Chthoniobacter flavus Ellin428 TaxID=497964 RepID=B4D9N0_9BACT|nr:hypothetical protein [Chthoniobacter flavus]EDY16811.1 hypothetical protein CfE428DRAFT_5620 [Chthoniobacter flavus Ellin428]TCO93364.1 hypothetical protein EV701_10468 [Chthoniobacter flavus]
MKRALGVFIVSIVLAGLPMVSSSADTAKLPAADREHLLQAKDPPLVTTMHEIPAEVVEACAAASSGGGFELADAGQPFQATDVIIGKPLPGKRLIWAARLPGYMVVHYESGGIAHLYHVMVVALDSSKKKVHVVWAAGARPMKSYAEFRETLATGKLD